MEQNKNKDVRIGRILALKVLCQFCVKIGLKMAQNALI